MGTGLSPEVLALACAPFPAFAPLAGRLAINGGQDSVPRGTFGPGSLLVVNAGEHQGIKVGDEFFARRVVRDLRRAPSRTAPGVVQTTGWIRIYSVDANLSLATITHACDTVNTGDFLEPFVVPVVPETVQGGEPERDNYAHVTVGIDQKTAFGKGDFFILDRGAAGGITPGLQFVVYRHKAEAGVFLDELGEAVAVSVQDETATLLVTRARDAFWKGDLVARRK